VSFNRSVSIAATSSCHQSSPRPVRRLASTDDRNPRSHGGNDADDRVANANTMLRFTIRHARRAGEQNQKQKQKQHKTQQNKTTKTN
jgi:hypothetical protein